MVSRLITSINFVEDPQSLAISLNVTNTDLLHLFNSVNSPLFCLLVKFISSITHNYAVSFSILGGVATFILIFYVLKLLKVPVTSLEGGLTIGLLFFNPLLWIAGNRYTPDLACTSLIIAAFYYLMSDHAGKYALSIGFLLTGIVGGFSLLYIPFLLIPVVHAATTKKGLVLAIFTLLIGLVCWMLPSILQQGLAATWNKEVAILFDVPNTGIYTLSRLVDLIKNIWAGGLGGYWYGRNLFTLLLSIALLPCLFFGMMIMLSFDYPRSKIFATMGTGLLFFVWLYVCPSTTNISVLVLLPFLIVLIAYGIIYFLVNFNMLAVKAAIVLFLLFNIWIGIYLALEHQNPNAAEQLRAHISQFDQQPVNILATADLCEFLNVQSRKLKCTVTTDGQPGLVKFYSRPSPTPSKAVPKSIYYFSHNPYINSWSFAIELREY